MKIERFIICICLMHRVVISHTCIGKKNLVDANGLDPDFKREAVRHLSCNTTETPISFYKCKAICMRTEQCNAMWHETLCHLCSYIDLGHDHMMNMDSFGFHSDGLMRDWMIGKYFKERESFGKRHVFSPVSEDYNSMGLIVNYQFTSLTKDNIMK